MAPGRALDGHNEVRVVVADDGVRGRVLVGAGSNENGSGQRTLALDQLEGERGSVTLVSDAQPLWLERGH